MPERVLRQDADRQGRALIGILGKRGRVLRLEVEAFDDPAEALSQSINALRAGDRAADHRRLAIRVARELLTWERLTLLRAIRQHKPRSVAALARAVNRAPERVQADLAFLEQHGIVTLRPATPKSRVRVPTFDYTEVEVRIRV